MPFQDEPRGSARASLPSFDITAAEVQQLLADPSGHGLSQYLLQHAEHFVTTGGNLKTPFRVLWYAECLGLTDQTVANGHKDSRPVQLRQILEHINHSNELNGKAPVSMSTVLNSLNPMARTLMDGFKVKVLINRQEETIKLLSEAFTANMFLNMKADAERVFKRYADVCEQAKAVGVETKGLMAGTQAGRFLTAVS
ncbi:MAG: hypothetical protein RL442_1819 [Pseudomonadota bacterium]